MADYYDERALSLGRYIADTGATVRATARVFGISKSTVHKDVTERLPQISQSLYNDVTEVLRINLAERHLRGGEATRVKYLHQAKSKI